MAIHKPVLLKEALDFLKVEKGKRFIDATVGEGGHALAIAQRGGIVLGIDQDPRILEQAKRSLGNKAVLIQGNFKEIANRPREHLHRGRWDFDGFGDFFLAFEGIRPGFLLPKG